MIISSYVIKVKTFPCGFGVDDSASNESRDLRKATSTVDYRLHPRRHRLFLFIVVVVFGLIVAIVVVHHLIDEFVIISMVVWFGATTLTFK